MTGRAAAVLLPRATSRTPAASGWCWLTLGRASPGRKSREAVRRERDAGATRCASGPPGKSSSGPGRLLACPSLRFPEKFDWLHVLYARSRLHLVEVVEKHFSQSAAELFPTVGR